MTLIALEAAKCCNRQAIKLLGVQHPTVCWLP
jgi:hypothetical protein